MAFVLVWSKSGDTEKHFEVFAERRDADSAALARQRQGSDAYVVSGELHAAEEDAMAVPGPNQGGFKA